MYTNATKGLHHPQSQAPGSQKLTIDSLHASWSKDGPSFPNEEFIQMMEWANARSHPKMHCVMCRPILTAKAEKPLRSPSTNKNTAEHFWHRRQHSVFSCRRSLFSLSPVSSFLRYMACRRCIHLLFLLPSLCPLVVSPWSLVSVVCRS